MHQKPSLAGLRLSLAYLDLISPLNDMSFFSTQEASQKYPDYSDSTVSYILSGTWEDNIGDSFAYSDTLVGL